MGNSGRQENGGNAGDSSSKSSLVSADVPRDSSCSESNKRNGGEGSNKGDVVYSDSSSKGGEAANVDVTETRGNASGVTTEARKSSPLMEQRSPPTIPRPTASTPNRSERFSS